MVCDRALSYWLQLKKKEARSFFHNPLFSFYQQRFKKSRKALWGMFLIHYSFMTAAEKMPFTDFFKNCVRLKQAVASMI